MLANIGKSILIDFAVSVCSLVLTAIVSILFSKLLGLEQTFNLIVFIVCLGGYVLLSKVWLKNQRSHFSDFASVIVVPIILSSFAGQVFGKPPYGPTLTLYNAYLSPLENIRMEPGWNTISADFWPE